MKIEVVYIYPANASKEYRQWALRFLQRYRLFEAGMDHTVTVVTNGGITDDLPYMFKLFLSKCRFFQHDNSGWDIGAFQAVAEKSDADLMIFLGTSAYVRGPGWLIKIAAAFQKHGDTLYGAMGNMGEPPFNRVSPHIRTSAFWMPPKLLNRYPHRVTQLHERYPFEHGPNSLTNWIRGQGMNVWVVTWNGPYKYPEWGGIVNGFQSGNQSAVMIGDKLCDPPFYPLR